MLAAQGSLRAHRPRRLIEAPPNATVVTIFGDNSTFSPNATYGPNMTSGGDGGMRRR